jgi:hypothetical protein
MFFCFWQSLSAHQGLLALLVPVSAPASRGGGGGEKCGHGGGGGVGLCGGVDDKGTGGGEVGTGGGGMFGGGRGGMFGGGLREGDRGGGARHGHGDGGEGGEGGAGGGGRGREGEERGADRSGGSPSDGETDASAHKNRCSAAACENGSSGAHALVDVAQPRNPENSSQIPGNAAQIFGEGSGVGGGAGGDKSAHARGVM